MEHLVAPEHLLDGNIVELCELDLGLADDFFTGHGDRVAGEEHLTAGIAADVVRAGGGVQIGVAHIAKIHTELFSADLNHCGLRAVAHIGGAGHQAYGAVRKADNRAAGEPLKGGDGARVAAKRHAPGFLHFIVVAQTLLFVDLLLQAKTAAEDLISGEGAQRRAAVDLFAGLEDVVIAELDRIPAHFAAGIVNEAFAAKRALRVAVAAERAGDGGIGRNADAVIAEVRHMVGHFTVGRGGDQRGVRAVATAVGVHDLMECDHLTILCAAHLHLGIGGVAHGSGCHFVAAVVDDLNGTVDQAGQRRGDVLMVHLLAGAERAANHGAVAADVTFGNAKLRGKDTAILIGDLARSPGVELVVAVPVGDTGNGLHWDRVLRRGAVGAFENIIALLKALFHLAAGTDLVAVEVVLVKLGVDDACALFDRLVDRHAGGQNLVFDLDGLERAVQRFLILGNDSADAVALVQGVPGEDRLVFDQ